MKSQQLGQGEKDELVTIRYNVETDLNNGFYIFEVSMTADYLLEMEERHMVDFFREMQRKLKAAIKEFRS